MIDFAASRTQRDPNEINVRRENAKKIFCKNNGRRYLTPEERAKKS